MLTQQLGDGEHEVGSGRTGRQRADELDPDDARQQHGQRLSQHRRLGLDPADTPSEHAETVDHGRVGVGADQRVGVGDAIAVPKDHLGEVLEIDLVTDPAVRREHT